jgi:hypothetical protein
MRAAMSAGTPSFLSRLAIALRDDRRRQVGIGAQQPVAARVGLAPFAALVAVGLVELAQHVGPHVGAPVVELFLELVFDDLAFLLDHQNLV